MIITKNGTITLFMFDPGEGLSEHAAPFDAIISILEREAEHRHAWNKMKHKQIFSGF